MVNRTPAHPRTGLFTPWAVLRLAGEHPMVVTYDPIGGCGYSLPEWRSGGDGRWEHDDDGTWQRSDGARPISVREVEGGMYHHLTGEWRPLVPQCSGVAGAGHYVAFAGWLPCIPYLETPAGWVDARLGPAHIAQ